MSCFVVPKNTVTILESNIPDEDSNYEQWSSKAYALGAEVQHGEDIFRSLADDNTAEPIAGTLTQYWKYLKKANKWAAFDDKNSTLTSNPLKIEYIVESRYVDYVGFFNATGQNIKVELFNLNDNVDTAIPIKLKEEQLTFRDVYSHASYITAETEYKKTVLMDLFPYFDTKMRITISATSGVVSIGHIIYGTKYVLGKTLASAGLTMDFSNLFDIDIDSETGEFNEVPILPRKDLTIPVLIETKDWERVTTKLTELMGQSCLYVALNEIKGVRPNIAVFGFYKTLRTPISLNHTQYELIIKGVI
jgi:hypothetical protein